MKINSIEELIQDNDRLIYYNIHSIFNSYQVNRNIYDINEFFQEVCLQLLIKEKKIFSSFNVEKGEVSTWLSRIIRNIVIDTLKKDKSQQELSFDDKFEYDNNLSFDDNFQKEIEDFRMDFEKISSENILTDRELLILKMYYFKEMNFKEISDFLEVKDSTVRVQKLNAIRKIKEYYEK